MPEVSKLNLREFLGIGAPNTLVVMQLQSCVAKAVLMACFVGITVGGPTKLNKKRQFHNQALKDFYIARSTVTKLVALYCMLLREFSIPDMT